MSQSLHICDEGCTCPIHGTPMMYWPSGDDHACQDAACEYAHGVKKMLLAADASAILDDDVDAEALGRMLHAIVNPPIRPGPPYVHTLTGPSSITCPVCGMTSYNETDAEEGFCGNCHDWTTPRS